MHGAWSVRRSVGMTSLVVLLGLVLVGLNTAVAYVTVAGPKAVPISTGILFCLIFMIALRLLHRAAWLAFLSILPALFVLVGSVQLAPEAVLEQRGIRQEVTIADVTVIGKRHAFQLRGDDGPIAEPLLYRGSSPSYRVGDRLTVLIDPDEAVELKAADRVDSSGKRTMLVLGGIGWSLMTLLAGWRGHVRRRKGRYDTFAL